MMKDICSFCYSFGRNLCLLWVADPSVHSHTINNMSAPKLRRQSPLVSELNNLIII